MIDEKQLFEVYDPSENELLTLDESAPDDQSTQLRRLAADLSNSKRRLEQEREKMEDNVTSEVVTKLLPVYEDIQRLADHEGPPQDLQQGIRAITAKWRQVMDQFEVCETTAVGDRFDPEIQEAVLINEVDDPAMDGRVVSVFAKGYARNDKILQFAKVAVGRYHGRSQNAHGNGQEND